MSEAKIPPLAQQLIHLGAVLVAIVVFSLNLKSDIRSNRENMDRVFADLTAIKQSLPNQEVTNLRFREIETRIGKLEEELEFEAAKQQKFRENLLSKGVLDR